MSEPSLPAEKRCSKCGNVKAVTEFYPQGKYTSSKCKKCSSEYFKNCDQRKCQETMPALPIVPNAEIRHCPNWTGYAVDTKGGAWSCRTPFRRWSRVVFRKTWRKLKPMPDGRLGHLRVQVRRIDGTCKREFVHRLVLEAFVGPCPDGMEACHSPDRNPQNNCVENLRWGTTADNTSDSIKDGTHYSFGSGEQHPGVKYSDEMVREIFAASQTDSLNKVASMFGVGKEYVAAIRSKRIRSGAIS